MAATDTLRDAQVRARQAELWNANVAALAQQASLADQLPTPELVQAAMATIPDRLEANTSPLRFMTCTTEKS